MSMVEAPSADAGMVAVDCADELDMDLIGDLEAETRVLLESTVDRGIDVVGELHFQRFFGGDLKRFELRLHTHLSLNGLLARCGTAGLHVGRTFLFNALRLAALRHRYPDDGNLRDLRPSHRVELLRLKKERDVHELAKAAFEGRYSVRRVRKAVSARLGALEPPMGPGALRAARTFASKVRDPKTGELRLVQADFIRFTNKSRREAMAEMDALIANAVELRALLADGITAEEEPDENEEAGLPARATAEASMAKEAAQPAAPPPPPVMAAPASIKAPAAPSARPKAPRKARKAGRSDVGTVASKASGGAAGAAPDGSAPEAPKVGSSAEVQKAPAASKGASEHAGPSSRSDVDPPRRA